MPPAAGLLSNAAGAGQVRNSVHEKWIPTSCRISRRRHCRFAAAFRNQTSWAGVKEANKELSIKVGD